MSAPKRFPDWLRERVRQEVAEATKPQPVKPKPATAKAAPVSKPTPPRRAGVTIMAAPDTAGPVEVANRQLMGPVQGRRADTDAHDTSEATPCYCCGGPTRRRAAVYHGPWRMHEPCTHVVGSEAARVQAAARRLGAGELSWTDAVLVASVHRVPSFADTHREPTWGTERQRDRMAWAHVDRKGLASAVAHLPDLRVEAGLDPATCTDGRCAWCGCSRSAGWFAYGHVWADGSPAPLCSACSAVYVKHGEPSFPDDVRAALAECITGTPPMMGTSPPDGLVPFADVGEGGDGTAWSHLPAEAVESYRWRVWTRFGGLYAPAEHREEAVRRSADRQAARAARRAEEEESEAARRNVDGF